MDIEELKKLIGSIENEIQSDYAFNGGNVPFLQMQLDDLESDLKKLLKESELD